MKETYEFLKIRTIELSILENLNSQFEVAVT